MRKQTLLLVVMLSLLLAAVLSASPAPAQAPEGGPDPALDALTRDYKPAAPLLPEGARVATAFKETDAPRIGIVDFVQNEAYVIHAADPMTAYKLVKSQPLFAGDSVMAGEKSAAALLLSDQSRISLGGFSKITLDKSVYDPDRNFRDTLVNLVIGKARFVVTKLGGMFGDSNNFQVDTPVGSCGVRGSDFVLALVPGDAAGKETGFLDFLSPTPAYAQTGLTLIAVAGPDTTLVVAGQAPTPPVPTSPTQTPRIFNNVAPGISVMGMPDFLE